MRASERAAWTLATVLGLAIVLSVAGIVRGGPLDPASPPSPTMRTLDELPPAWGLSLSATGGCSSQRFACVLSGVGVLDRETGLVWDRNPEADQNWLTAKTGCRNAVIGNRKGWRLPTLSELQTLIDPAASPKVPSGNPFNVLLTTSVDFYWTSTENPVDSSVAWTVTFQSGGHAEKLKTDTTGRHTLCVRNAGHEDASYDE